MIPELLYEIYKYLNKEDYIKLKDVEERQLSYLVEAFRGVYEARLLKYITFTTFSLKSDPLSDTYVWADSQNNRLQPPCDITMAESVEISQVRGKKPAPTIKSKIDLRLLAGIRYIAHTDPQWRSSWQSIKHDKDSEGFYYHHLHWTETKQVNNSEQCWISHLLILLARHGYLEIIKVLLDHEDVPLLWYDTAPFALEAASEGGHLDIIAYLFDNIIDKEHSHFRKSIHKSMELAIFYDHIDIIKYLLKNIDEKDIITMDMGYINWMQVKLIKSELLNYKVEV